MNTNLFQKGDKYINIFSLHKDKIIEIILKNEGDIDRLLRDLNKFKYAQGSANNLYIPVGASAEVIAKELVVYFHELKIKDVVNDGFEFNYFPLAVQCFTRVASSPGVIWNDQGEWEPADGGGATQFLLNESLQTVKDVCTDKESGYKKCASALTFAIRCAVNKVIMERRLYKNIDEAVLNKKSSIGFKKLVMLVEQLRVLDGPLEDLELSDKDFHYLMKDMMTPGIIDLADVLLPAYGILDKNNNWLAVKLINESNGLGLLWMLERGGFRPYVNLSDKANGSGSEALKPLNLYDFMKLAASPIFSEKLEGVVRRYVERYDLNQSASVSLPMSKNKPITL